MGNVVYNTGKYVIVYGFNNHQQVIFSAHHDEVTCLCMHPEGQLVASGEAGLEPRVLVWHSVTREVVFQDRGFHSNGIAALAFSCDGTFLAVAGNDVRHRVSVHKWESREVSTMDVYNGMRV